MRTRLFSLLCIIFSLLFVQQTFGQTCLWAKSAEGIHINGFANSVTTDALGNVYITGFFYSPTITFGTTTLLNTGGNDIFLVKYDATGNVLWAKSAGGIADDYVRSVTSDASGNVYVTGSFFSPTIIFGTTTLVNAGTQDIFLVKYNTSGTVIWAKSAGGAANDEANYVATDASGNIYIAGYFYSTIITFGSTTFTNASGCNAFLTKYDALGNVVWAKDAEGNALCDAVSVTTDALGNVYIAGGFTSTTISFGTTILTNTDSICSSNDIFLVKYDTSGSLVWAKSAGSCGNDFGYSVTTDALGNVYITGEFNSRTISFGTTNLTNNDTSGSTYDFLLIKYDATGAIIWAKSSGGKQDDYLNSVTTDAFGSVYITGCFLSPTITFGTTTLTNMGFGNIFLVKYNSTGSIEYVKSIGGNRYDYANAVTTDDSGNVYISGGYTSLSITFGTYILTNDSIIYGNSFLAKYASTVSIPTILNETYNLQFYPNPTDNALNLTIDNPTDISAVQVYDMMGKVVFQNADLVPQNFINKTININLPYLQDGMYILRVMGRNNSEFKQFVVKH